MPLAHEQQVRGVQPRGWQRVQRTQLLGMAWSKGAKAAQEHHELSAHGVDGTYKSILAFKI